MRQLHSLHTLSITDYMTVDPVTLAPRQALEQAMVCLCGNAGGGVPVLEAGQLVGMLCESDALKGALDASYHRTEMGRVGEYMSREPHCLPAEATIQEAAEIFLRLHLRCLPVVRAGRLLGVLSRGDVLRALWEDP